MQAALPLTRSGLALNTGCEVGCSHVKMNFPGVPEFMNVNRGECEAIAGACQVFVYGATRTCHTSVDVASANCFTPCA